MAHILTIGHSNHDWPKFLELCRGAGVTAIADVRTVPFCRYTKHFSRGPIQSALREARIAYVYLGAELGGRPAGIGDSAEAFERGLQRVLDGAGRYRIALMCAEHDPIDCHRLRIAHALQKRGAAVAHIHRTGLIESHEDVVRHLLMVWEGE